MATTSDSSVIRKLLKAMENADEQEPLTWAIERYLIKRERSKRRVRRHVISMVPRPRPGGRLSPSSIGGCHREAVFKFLGVQGKRKIDTELELIFEDGNWRHHKWQALFKDMQRVLGRKNFRVIGIEVSAVIEGLYVAGSLDIHIVVKGVHYIIDIKGINDYGFRRVCLDLVRPLDHHIDQLIAYMKAKKVQRGVILYENKNNNQYKPFLFKFDKEVWKEVVAWCDKTINYVERQKLPPRHPDCASGVFKYQRCIYRYLCFGKMEHDEIRELAYANFTSVEQMWEEGFAAFQEAMEAAA